jgi:hypothetical protein
MIEELMLTDNRIPFDLNELTRWHIPHRIIQPEHENRPGGNGDDQERQDTIQPITDPLWKALWWWVVEVLPVPYVFQDMTGRWLTTFW